MSRLNELRYVYRVEAPGHAIETLNMNRAYYYLGEFSVHYETATLTVLTLNIATQKYVSQAQLAHSVAGRLEEITKPVFSAA